MNWLNNVCQFLIINLNATITCFTYKLLEVRAVVYLPYSVKSLTNIAKFNQRMQNLNPVDKSKSKQGHCLAEHPLAS